MKYKFTPLDGAINIARLLISFVKLGFSETSYSLKIVINPVMVCSVPVRMPKRMKVVNKYTRYFYQCFELLTRMIIFITNTYSGSISKRHIGARLDVFFPRLTKPFGIKFERIRMILRVFMYSFQSDINNRTLFNNNVCSWYLKIKIRITYKYLN